MSYQGRYGMKNPPFRKSIGGSLQPFKYSRNPPPALKIPQNKDRQTINTTKLPPLNDPLPAKPETTKPGETGIFARYARLDVFNDFSSPDPCRSGGRPITSQSRQRPRYSSEDVQQYQPTSDTSFPFSEYQPIGNFTQVQRP